MTLERKDLLRRKPRQIRYFFLAESNTNIHTGMSYGGLEHVKRNHGILRLYFADLVTKRVVEVKEPIHSFMLKWRANYNNPEWCYEDDVKGVTTSGEGERK